MIDLERFLQHDKKTSEGECHFDPNELQEDCDKQDIQQEIGWRIYYDIL